MIANKPEPTPRERIDRYREVVGTLQLNEELAKRRAAVVRAQLDHELADVAEHVERHEGAKRELARLEALL
jgi:hypothetical protein